MEKALLRHPPPKKKGIFIPRVHLDPAGATNQYLTVASIRNATAPPAKRVPASLNQ